MTRWKDILHAVSRFSCAFIVVTAPGAGAADPYIELGPVGLALDQPRVAIEVYDPDAPGGPEVFGPTFFNSFLLDTGASGILVAGTAATELVTAGMQNVAIYDEQGVAGTSPVDVSASYSVDYAATDGIRYTVDDVHLMSSSSLNLGSFNGILGMPAMLQKNTTIDMTGWSTGESFFMDVEFNEGPPPVAGHRYEIPLTLSEFPLTGQRDPNDPLPTSAPLPYVTVQITNRYRTFTGNFIADTGAQLSVISTATAFALAMDEDNDGNFENEKLFELDVGGIGGAITVPVLAGDRMILSTVEGVDITWTKPYMAVVDIDESIAGVIGMDLLTSGWFDKVFLGAEEDGYLDYVHFDFTDSDQMVGSMFLDVNPSRDVLRLPGDGNENGQVEIGDFTVWGGNFGLEGDDLAVTDGDYNRDGRVDIGDFTVWGGAFGSVLPGSGPLPVPEPASWLLAIAALFFFLVRRARR